LHLFSDIVFVLYPKLRNRCIFSEDDLHDRPKTP